MGGERQRKRSTAITLVLAGSTLAGCSGPVEQRDAYASLDDCVKDWKNPAQCQPVKDGRFSSNYYYGPSYFGPSLTDGRPKPSPNAMDAVRLASTSGSSSSSGRSWFSSGSSSSSASHTSSSSSSSHSSSRGGFGSTGHSFSSSGSS
jgi:uncharacterized protein YgiB involved in biofilm formation